MPSMWRRPCPLGTSGCPWSRPRVSLYLSIYPSLVTGSCVIRETTQTGCPWSRPRVSLSIYLSLYRCVFSTRNLSISIYLSIYLSTETARARVHAASVRHRRRWSYSTRSCATIPLRCACGCLGSSRPRSTVAWTDRASSARLSRGAWSRCSTTRRPLPRSSSCSAPAAASRSAARWSPRRPTSRRR